MFPSPYFAEPLRCRKKVGSAQVCVSATDIFIPDRSQEIIVEIGLGFQVPSSTRKGKNRFLGFFICMSGRPGSWSPVV